VINIICALGCEAKPLISHLQLKRSTAAGYRLYENSEINLLITGAGNRNFSELFSIQALRTQQPAAWLNIGIAGHGTLAVGDGRLINKISLRNGNNSWYPPPLVFENRNDFIESISLVTVDEPETKYLEDCAYDMEAFYFYQAATKLQTSELVHCYKIISDNRQTSTDTINTVQVVQMVKNRLTDITAIVEVLSGMMSVIPGNSHQPFEEITRLYRFTQYQKHELGKLLSRLSVLDTSTLDVQSIPRLKSGAQVLQWLKNEIGSRPVKFW